MKSDWKKAILGIGVAVLFAWIHHKFKTMIESVIMGKIASNLGELWVAFKGRLEGAHSQLLGKLADIEGYIKILAKVTGGVVFIAGVLAPVTKELALGDPTKEVPLEKPAMAQL